MAYWDTEQRGQPPPALGEIKGTPTIRAFAPSRSSAKNAKRALEYNAPRELKDLLRFATSNMPSFVERLADAEALAAFEAKAGARRRALTSQRGAAAATRLRPPRDRAERPAPAAEWGLPTVLVFSKSAGTSSSLKALSAEYRRRLLIGEVKASKATAAAVERFGVESFPAMVAPRPSGEPLRFAKEPTYHRMDAFLRKVALRKPVVRRPAAGAEPEPEPEEPKEEL